VRVMSSSQAVKKRPRQQGAHGGAKSKAARPVAPLLPNDLPIHEHKQLIIDTIKSHRTTILVGETGTGKSTQLPQYLADAFGGAGSKAKCVVCTQPRRVAAVTIAQKVAEEQGCAVGERVGYSIRFEDRCSQQTRIKFTTDGVLLRECMSDPLLSKYSVVILDEAHERSLQTDILMGLLRELQEKRSDLRIVVMSATLQTELFENFFQVRSLSTLSLYPLSHYPLSHLLYLPSTMFPFSPIPVLQSLPSLPSLQSLLNLPSIPAPSPSSANVSYLLPSAFCLLPPAFCDRRSLL